MKTWAQLLMKELILVFTFFFVGRNWNQYPFSYGDCFWDYNRLAEKVGSYSLTNQRKHHHLNFILSVLINTYHLSNLNHESHRELIGARHFCSTSENFLHS